MEQPPGITLLGLGPGDPDLLTRKAWEVLATASEIYLRTRQHPTIRGLPAQIHIHSFDYLYEENDTFSEVYAQIVNRVIELGKRPQGVVYAVPGHPFIAEITSPRILERAREQEIPVRVIHGLSFIEPTFTALGVDAFPQTALVDALELAVLHHPPFPASAPALIAQIHSPAVASEVKLILMAEYPDDHPVRLVHAAGTVNTKVIDLPLFKMDREPGVGLLTSLYVPALAEDASFEAFQEIVAHLRAPEGCPWDREQTHQSLRSHLLEEAFEVLAALDADNPDAMREEFGDLLLQIVLHAQIASEYGEFNMSEVISGIHSKLIRRHPHVFGDMVVKDKETVLENWEKLKASEREFSGKKGQSILEGVALALPALVQADEYQQRAARVGFDWPNALEVLDKVSEEISEIQQANSAEEREAELGDLLFAIVNLSRWLEVDAESALRASNARFRRRFAYIEVTASEQGRQLSDLTLEEMDALWKAAKDKE
jgi:tetrapyrrole methylase family protein / MazG family protein